MPQNTSFPTLIVGLGNPGDKYSDTRHNIGFHVIEALAKRLGASVFLSKFHAHTAEIPAGAAGFAHKVLLMKPQTFMNRSGLSVGEAATFFKIPAENVLVISDDLDLPPGALRIRASGGAGGHNGLKSVIQSLGTEAFPRLRIGVGRDPQLPADVHVLARIPKGEQALFQEAVEKASEAVSVILKDGFVKGMNGFNTRATKKTEEP